MNLGRAIRTWPLADRALGATGGQILDRLVSMEPERHLAAARAIALLIVLTGGLHEDGLADTADGFSGGRDKARKRAIMRDSRIASYGAMALGTARLIRMTAAITVPPPAVAVACGLGRAGGGRDALPCPQS